ncbi:MAG: class I SAM-dependent methyltransferase [Acholeplasmataceae bacterium]|nr:class I SAM-dependent methyltransferase [Acholeplasmataceae bacterium]
MKKSLVLDLAHMMLSLHVNKDDVVIDATVGNGHDTLFLSRWVKHVYAFDIQMDAIRHSKTLLDLNHVENVTLIHDSHENMLDHVSDFKGVIFNLGYLPGGDKSKTTTSDVTIRTIEKILPMLKPDGFIQLVVYPGHAEGYVELQMLEAFLMTLDTAHHKIVKAYLPYQDNNPPIIFHILKCLDRKKTTP